MTDVLGGYYDALIEEIRSRFERFVYISIRDWDTGEEIASFTGTLEAAHPQTALPPAMPEEAMLIVVGQPPGFDMGLSFTVSRVGFRGYRADEMRLEFRVYEVLVTIDAVAIG